MYSVMRYFPPVYFIKNAQGAKDKTNTLQLKK